MMKYVDKPGQLAKVAEVLAGHQSEIGQYFLGQLRARLMGVASVEDRLRILFIVAYSDKRRTDREELGRASATFGDYLKTRIASIRNEMDLRVQHELFLASLCEIPGMKQKTANLLIKYLAMFQDELGLELLDWRSWQPYLHVPLDIWVMRLLGKNFLDVCGSEFEEAFADKKKGGNYVAPTHPHTAHYRDLQSDLVQAASLVQQPAIVFDTLWFIGAKYCAYRPLLCEFCWIREYCQNQTVVARQGVPREPRPGRKTHIVSGESLFARLVNSKELHGREKSGTEGVSYHMRVRDSKTSIWVKIEDRATFDRLMSLKKEIEGDFGAPLEWRPSDKYCRVKYHMPSVTGLAGIQHDARLFDEAFAQPVVAHASRFMSTFEARLSKEG